MCSLGFQLESAVSCAINPDNEDVDEEERRKINGIVVMVVHLLSICASL